MINYIEFSAVILKTGIHTDICVKHTALDAFVRGCDIVLPGDAITSFQDKNHAAALA
jgi:nicotinamidase-related amidase